MSRGILGLGFPKWLEDKGQRTLYLLLPIVLLSSSYQGFDGMIMNGLQLLPSWRSGLLNSIQTVGALIALPFVAWIVEKLGRRSSIVFGAAWTIVGAVLQASSKDIPQFVIARFLIGVGLAFVTVAAPLLLAELALPQHRGTVIAWYPTCWYVGAIIAAWTTYGTRQIQNSWSWRIPSLLQGIPALIQISLIYFVPESPRWLISKGKEQAAREVLVKYHANGNANHPLVDLEYNEIKDAIETDRHIKAKGNWKDLVRSKPNRRRLIIVFFCGVFLEISGNGLVQYYLHSILVSIGITSTKTQTTINGCLSIYNFVVATGASLFVERFGRRPLFLTSTAGLLVAFVLWTAFSERYVATSSSNWGIAVLVAIFLSNGAYSIGWTPLWAYPAEILPYEIRARGVTFQTGVMHIFGFFGTFVNPIGLANAGWKYYIAYIVYTCLEFTAVWYFFVETKGFTLEEIARIFDTPGLTWKQRRNFTAPGQLAALGPNQNASSTNSISEDGLASSKEKVAVVSTYAA